MVDRPALIQTGCSIVGGGPAGAMLGLLLARSGVDVTVLEKHGDFLRDFRGDTIHPSTLEILDQLGLAEDFLSLRPNLTPVLSGETPLGPVAIDFRRLRTRFRYIAFIPQWDFLEFITQRAAPLPGFHLRMNSEAVDLVVEDGQVRGVRVEEPGGALDVRAALTVAADGRSSLLRERAGLPLVNTSPPVDVLWFRLSRRPGDPEQALGRVGAGGVLVLLNRGGYWQTAYTIPKGSFQVLRAAGLQALRSAIAARAPELADRVQELTSWEQVRLLTVQANRLTRWYRPGLLCIGDAAHAMSPVAGVGINFAIQDAVEAANRLTGPLLAGRVGLSDLAAVQRRRAWQVRTMQFMQARALEGALRLANPSRPRGPAVARLVLRAFRHLPLLRDLPARVVGLGFRRVRVRPPAGGLGVSPAREGVPAGASAPRAGAGSPGRTSPAPAWPRPPAGPRGR
ncbi:MAG: FAD-dependent oxidoreductase [Candidatus Dormibacteraeota bacterium]|nr:FAD-dependent oxidoreductase [Candidatus Dormibacteraeota bacterium]